MKFLFPSFLGRASLSLGLALGLSAATAVRADIRMPSIFSDHMVLQAGLKGLPIWGTADEGEEVTVLFQGQRGTVKAKDGKWMIRLNPLATSATPDVLKVSGRNRLQFQDVLVGEVWICSGQSNMEWPMSAAFEPQADIEKSNNPNIRLYTVPKTKSNEPLEDVKSSWLDCKPHNVRFFSAVGYYFGRELQKSMNVPVGLIHTSWGGSPAEVWMSRQSLEAKPEYLLDIVTAYDDQYAKYKEAKAKFDAETDALKKKGEKPTAKAPAPPSWKPSELYNGMIHPIAPYGVKGAIWYQGESNAGRAAQYRTLFPDMIKNWRQTWGQLDFTFLAVQLAPFMKIETEPTESQWAELREAQMLAIKVLPKVGVAVITDVGDEKDIHPKKKEPVGVRLAVAARGIAYGQKNVYSGPTYKNMKFKTDKVAGDRIILTFDHVGGGLEARDGELKGFAICGADKKFVWGKAEILPDNTIAVSHPDIKKPTAVRFGWANYPVVNLWNKDGLPASPFRTDEPKK